MDVDVDVDDETVEMPPPPHRSVLFHTVRTGMWETSRSSRISITAWDCAAARGDETSTTWMRSELSSTWAGGGRGGRSGLLGVGVGYWV